MRPDLTALERRRLALVARVDAERAELERLFADLAPGIAIADRVAAAVVYVRSHPVLAFGVSAAAAFVLRRRFGRILRGASIASLAGRAAMMLLRGGATPPRGS